MPARTYENAMYLQGDIKLLVDLKVVAERRPIRIAVEVDLETLFSSPGGRPEIPVGQMIVGQRTCIEVDGKPYATTTRFILKKLKDGGVSLRLFKKYTALVADKGVPVRLRHVGDPTVPIPKPRKSRRKKA